jgi:hypothetical protein
MSMRRQVIRAIVVLLAAGLLSAGAFGQNGEPAPEQYSATWAVTGGTGGGTSVPIDIHITRYNTNEEIAQYASVLAEKGPAALRAVLEKQDVGQFSPVGRVGTTLCVARKLLNGDTTVVRVLTLRDITFQELRNNGRSVDYPYTMLELTLAKDGNGTGAAIRAAKISFNKKKNNYEIESFGHGQAYNKLLNVRRVK